MGFTQKGSTAWLRHQIIRDRIWRVVDARDQVLGRLSTQIATLLQGKHKPTYLDNMNCGDPVIVINARHIVLTGRKKYNKHYIHHSGYPGGLKRVPIAQVMERRPKDVIRLAVKRMLPGNRLRDVWLSNLRIFMDEEHDHESQRPEPVPPAHCGPRLGGGGPPTFEELSHWWVENLMDVPDDILREVMTEVREEVKADEATSIKKLGIAQALDFGPGDDRSEAEASSMAAYIRTTEEMLKQDPVIVPPHML